MATLLLLSRCDLLAFLDTHKQSSSTYCSACWHSSKVAVLATVGIYVSKRSNKHAEL